MKIIYFFDKYIKPLTMKGAGLCHPADTAIIGDGLCCIREYDVNIWLYKKGSTTIAFDAGHLNYDSIDKEFSKINVKADSVKAVFLTHADVDHGGGIDKNGENIFPAAEVYLGEKEEAYITNATHRIKRFGVKIKNCVRLCDGYNLLKDREILYIDSIKIQVIYTPGHTLGHVCYLIDDKILISGDCLAVNKNGGYSFPDFFTQYPEINKASLRELRDFVAKKAITYVCTGHSGYYSYQNDLFRNIEISASGSKKKPFDETAPIDLFKS